MQRVLDLAQDRAFLISQNGNVIRKALPFAALSIGVAFTIWLVVAVRAFMITVNRFAWRQALARLVNVQCGVFPLVR